MHSPPMPTATNRSWVGFSSLSANRYPNGGPWRQFHCIACGGYAFETYGTILHGKRMPADLVAAVGRRVNTVCKHEVDLRQQLVVFHIYHNLRLPHSSIRQALFQPKATNGTGSVKRWRPCPPAMAAGLHPPLPLGGRLVGMLGAIVEAAVLAMFRARQHFPLGRLVAFEPIRDEDPWHTGQALWVG